MQEFFNKLYEIENFTIYLIIAIAVLLILFLIILLMGKKDQKLEETKRMQALTKDGFKEESEKVSLETKKKETADILIAPVGNSVKEEVKSLPEPDKEEIKNELPEIKDIKPEEKEVKVTEVTPNKPILDEVKNDPIQINVEEPKEEKKEEPVLSSEIKLPDFNFDEVTSSLEKEEKEEKPKFENTQVFSSVFVDKKEPQVIEIPMVKEEVELPKLKEDSNEETSFSLDNLSGETYDIEK